MTDTIAPPGRPRRPVTSERRTRPDIEVVGDDPGDEHPRFRRRRHAVLAAARRRRRSIVVVVAVVLALVTAAVAATRSALLDVDAVRVTGVDDASVRSAVEDASGVRVGDALVDVDAEGARRAVMAVPGVASATVAVEWPDAVRVKVTPEEPLVRLRVGDGPAVVVARGGRVVGPVPEADADGGGGADAAAALPELVLDGAPPGGTEPGATVSAPVRGALVVFEQLSDALRARLPTATLAADGSLTFSVADDGGTVRFGPADEVPAKLLALASVFDNVETRCLEVLDVREPMRPTILRTAAASCQLGPPTVGAPTTTTPRSTTTTAPSTGATAGRKGATSGGGTTGGTTATTPKGATTTTPGGTSGTGATRGR